MVHAKILGSQKVKCVTMVRAIERYRTKRCRALTGKQKKFAKILTLVQSLEHIYNLWPPIIEGVVPATVIARHQPANQIIPKYRSSQG